ncbi:unnamed protein product, partial [Staurois parvus]
MARDCGHSTGDGQRLRTQYRRWPETVDIVQGMTRDYGQYRWPETADSAGNDQRMQTVKEMTRDCG